MHPTPRVEPGCASHDQARRDGTLLVSYSDMSIHGTINAVSYFQAKAADLNVGPHGGCIPITLSDLGMRSQFVSVDGQAGAQRSWGATLRRAPCAPVA